ncbi:hypothetical protein TSUD_255580 [Trifolium subterraneum]|uniref:Uncharacterized protein n=1 Tax=Trifolium subterraneum TaxID=3900 RepID=A0A2Z6MW76_TRISU|nr:hypothetical protein TSUD_255580 [Trifolium subterraneum]
MEKVVTKKLKRKVELEIAMDRYIDRYKEKMMRVVSRVKKGEEEWRKGHAEEGREERQLLWSNESTTIPIYRI